jgi:hypothetical protein
MRSGEHEEALESGTRDRSPVWFPLVPASIVAVGNPEQPVGRLLTLQSAIARGVHLATSLDRLRLLASRHSLMSIRFW